MYLQLLYNYSDLGVDGIPQREVTDRVRRKVQVDSVEGQPARQVGGNAENPGKKLSSRKRTG